MKYRPVIQLVLVLLFTIQPATNVPARPRYGGGTVIIDTICGKSPIPVIINGPLDVDENGIIDLPPHLDADAITDDGVWMEGYTITFCPEKGGPTYPIDFKFRGSSRLWECKIPPATIRFSRDDIPEFIVSHGRKIKLVYECEDRTRTGERVVDLDQMALAEHLLYETMRVLDVETFNTHLIWLSIVGDNGQILNGYAFFQEHKENFARRLGARLDGGRINADKIIFIHLANKLIANIDFSFGHNLLSLEYEDGRGDVVPYDFDRSNIVWCPTYPDRDWCAGVLSYIDTYNDIMNYLESILQHELGSIPQYLDQHEIKRAFILGGLRILFKKDKVLKIADNNLLSPARKTVMLIPKFRRNQ